MADREIRDSTCLHIHTFGHRLDPTTIFWHSGAPADLLIRNRLIIGHLWGRHAKTKSRKKNVWLISSELNDCELSKKSAVAWHILIMSLRCWSFYVQGIVNRVQISKEQHTSQRIFSFTTYISFVMLLRMKLFIAYLTLNYQSSNLTKVKNSFLYQMWSAFAKIN